MIEKLDISQFLSFHHLVIPKLNRINLISGRNNSGKTALLEAIRILSSEGENGVINNILKNRGLFYNNLYDIYEGLFNRKMISNNSENFHLSINDLVIRTKERNTFNHTFEVVNAYGVKKDLRPDNSGDFPRDQAVFIPFQINFQVLNQLWEPVVLTPKEDDVLDILRESIEPMLMRFDISEKSVRVRLKGEESPLPLQTLGDGVQRMLMVALSLANAQGRYLLIDEIELGLHYSVLEKLWKMIFTYALKWDIQIFVTTHSQDAILSFHQVASSNDTFHQSAEFIRLQIGRNGENEAIVYDGNRLEETLDLELEIR